MQQARRDLGAQEQKGREHDECRKQCDATLALLVLLAAAVVRKVARQPIKIPAFDLSCHSLWKMILNVVRHYVIMMIISALQMTNAMLIT